MPTIGSRLTRRKKKCFRPYVHYLPVMLMTIGPAFVSLRLLLYKPTSLRATQLQSSSQIHEAFKNPQRGQHDVHDQVTSLKPSQLDGLTKSQPKRKFSVAYAISITECSVNSTMPVFDGPAILSHSIRELKNTSKYSYDFYAFVHQEAANCTHFLDHLGYKVLIKEIPVDISKIESIEYQTAIEENGCCGSREFLKLWAYTLTDHDVVVHTDSDVMILQPIDELFDAMLFDENDTNRLSDIDVMHRPMPHGKVEFFYTRDYLQRSRITSDPSKYGVQGGFFVLKPNLEVFNDMQLHLLKGEYRHSSGWPGKYGGFWGAAQIQGFLSYYYGVVRPQKGVELNRCVYNTMVDDDPIFRGKCRTGQDECQDCRETPLHEMKVVHLTTCWKPWHCPKLKKPHPERCADVHRAWFELRKSLELSWGYQVPTEGWWFQRTLGYCTKAGGAKIRYYLPLQFPNNTKTQ